MRAKAILPMCALVLIAMSSSCAAMPEVLQSYRSDPGETSQARALLRAVPGDSVFFPWILSENARLAYRTDDWPAFFGITTYARQFHSKAIETEKIRLLEILALMRHCRWDEAKRVTQEAMQIQKTIWAEALGFLSHGLSVAPALPSDSRSQLRDKPRDTILPHFSLWKTGKVDPRKLPVDRLRRVIEPLCEDDATERAHAPAK